MNKLLEVKDLTVAFKLNDALKNAVNHISFDLYEKDFVGLVGESGCGKTVATQTILGIQSLDANILSGSCKLKDKEILNISEKEWQKYRATCISTIFQEPGSALNPLQKGWVSEGDKNFSLVTISFGLKGVQKMEIIKIRKYIIKINFPILIESLFSRIILTSNPRIYNSIKYIYN